MQLCLVAHLGEDASYFKRKKEDTCVRLGEVCTDDRAAASSFRTKCITSIVDVWVVFGCLVVGLLISVEDHAIVWAVGFRQRSKTNDGLLCTFISHARRVLIELTKVVCRRL